MNNKLCTVLLITDTLWEIQLQTNLVFLSLQTSEGVPQKVFKTLKDLIYNYEKPNQGLVTKLRYPVKKTSSSRRSQRFKTGNDDIYDEIDESDYVDVLS